MLTMSNNKNAVFNVVKDLSVEQDVHSKFGSLIKNKDVTVNWYASDKYGRPVIACWSGRDALISDESNEELVITFHLSGRVHLRHKDPDGSTSHMIRAKSLGITRPGDHEWYLEGEFELLHIYLWPDENGILGQPKQSINVGIKDSWLRSLCELFLAYGPKNLDKMEAFYESVKGFIEEHVSESYLKNTSSSASHKIYYGGFSGPQLSIILDYFHKEFRSDVNVSNVSQIFGCSSSHFFRAFREAVGCSPYNYLIKLRIDEAKTLLQNTSTPVKQIAAEVGFNSLSSFGSVFKNITGVTPGFFRKQKP